MMYESNEFRFFSIGHVTYPESLKTFEDLNCRVMHPGNNNKCVNVALAVFDETIVAIRSY